MTVHRMVPVAVMMVHAATSARMKAYPIVCGRCRHRDGMPGVRFQKGVPWSLFQDHFVHKGWELGRKPEQDRCPKCVKAETDERRAKHHKPVDVGKAAKKVVPAPQPSATVVALNAPQPQYHFGPTYGQLRELQIKIQQAARAKRKRFATRARAATGAGGRAAEGEARNPTANAAGACVTMVRNYIHGVQHQTDPRSLGPCCQCECTDGVRNIFLLNRRGAIPGRGWGCVVCGLPPDGAVAVLCDACVECLPAALRLRRLSRRPMAGDPMPICRRRTSTTTSASTPR